MSEMCPEGYLPFSGLCPSCGGDWFDYRKNGPHMEVFCIVCSKHVAFVPKLSIEQWKKAVKARDFFTCQRCGKVGTSNQVEAHHKIPVWFTDKSRLSFMKFDMDNGITLCKQCHKQIHGASGTIKDNKEE